MDLNDIRKQFEDLVSKDPYGLNLERFPKDPTRYAWPGAYKDDVTVLAWDIWCEAYEKAIQLHRPCFKMPTERSDESE